MEFFKKNFVLLLAFALPIILIAGVALSVHLSSLKPTTTYNFVYTTCTDGTNYTSSYYCDTYLQKRYSVAKNKIVVNEVASSTEINNSKEKLSEAVPEEERDYTARLFLHDSTTNVSREITLSEAEELSLSSLLTSPDGFTISSDYDRSGGGALFIFGGGYSSFGYYLKKGDDRKHLNLVNNNGNYYEDNFHFIGWVLPKGN